MMRTCIHAVAALASVVLCTGLMGCDDTFDEGVTKPSAETIRQYVEKGWLPRAVPQEIDRLRVAGDLDAERGVGALRSDHVDDLLSHCQVSTSGYAMESALPKWFPQEVRDARSSDQLRREGYTTYLCEEDFAVIRKKADTTVYFWSDREDDD